MPTIRVDLPVHLRRLANIPGHETTLDVPPPPPRAPGPQAPPHPPPTPRGPQLPTDTPLPDAILIGREPLIILGAIAGG